MADRTVKVTMSAQVQGYVDAMQKASEATRTVGSEAEKLAQQRQAFQTLGTGMVAVGGAITAIGVAAMKTGIEYNAMQQSSRAALLTMLGSSQAVNAQMDKLDAFARNSPFSKATFIQAQQQMLAFGIETQKVIPYLDAVQNAVAAAGGSNAEIEGIVATMSKIQSSSKITAQDLIEFGNRGVNAADLIGSQMGKTGAQIRSDITSGSLDATDALDALAAGMSKTFDGAAANVKETFDGAMDRVKAAWRDFSAEIATPLVNPEGGGGLVDFMNGLADSMREFEKLPEPVKVATSGIIGIGGAALLAGGSMLLAVPKIVEYREALATMSPAAQKVSGALGGIGKGLAVVAGGLIAAKVLDSLATAGNDAAMGLEKMEQVVRADGLNAAFQGLSGESEDLASALELIVGDSLNSNMERFGSTLNRMLPFDFADNVKDTEERFATLDARLAGMVSDGNAAQAAKEFEEIAAAAKSQGIEVEKVEGLLPGYEEALAGAANASEDATRATNDNADALAELQGKASATTEEVETLADVIRGLGEAQFDVRDANRKLEESLDDLSGKLLENGLNLDITTEAGRQNEAAIDAAAQAAIEHSAAVLEQTNSEEAAAAALDVGRQKLIDMLEPYFATRDAAQAYVDTTGLVEPQKVTDFIANTAQATSQIRSLKSWIDSIDREVAVMVTSEWQSGGGGGGGAAGGWADGGIIAYENGGISEYQQAFAFAAGGGVDTGIYTAGTPIIKFAEPETRWEAFISGKPGQEERNRQIWVETGRKLGMDTGGQTVVQQVPTELVVRDVDGALIGRMQVEAARKVSDASAAGGSRVRQGSDRRR